MQAHQRLEYEMPRLRMAAPMDMMVHESLEEGIA